MSPRSTRTAQRLNEPAFFGLSFKMLVAFVLFVVLTGTANAFVSRTLTINANLPRATAGVAYNAVISVSGGTAPYHFSIPEGSLPGGLRLNATTGSVSGTAQGNGTSRFIIAVSDSGGNTARQAALIVVGGSEGAISVTISPTSAQVQPGGTQQFSATVRNTSQTGVTWSASAGTVSTNGLFTAPKVTATTAVTVTATSVADTTKQASASVTVSNGAPPPPPPPPPPGTLTIVTTAVPGATTGSPYAATLSATGGQQPYQWSLASGSLPSGIQLNATSGLLSGTSSNQGQFNFTAQVKDAAAKTATQALTLVVSTQPTGGKFDGPAELPRVYVQSLLANTPAPGTTISVPAGGNLQTALNSASCGDTISLQAGATFAGVFTFPAKACDSLHWIIVRTSAPDTALPPEGTRITPCYAGVASLPARPSLNCKSTQNVMAKIVMGNLTGSGPIQFASGASYYRLLGLEITRNATGTYVGSLASAQAGAAINHIVFDRVWVHGTAHDETQNGIRLNGVSYFAVVDSYLNDFHCIAVTGSCTDGNAIGGGLGTIPAGPIKVVDNFLEGGGQCFILGGGAATQTPADIEFRRNHLFKPLIWMQGQPGFVGGANGSPFTVKNHFELKNAQRVLFEGNIMENVWGGFSQKGFFVLLTPKNQSAGTISVCPLCQVTDVTIRYSTFSHAGAGMQVANGASDTGGLPLDGERYSIHDVTLDDVDGVKYNGSGNLFNFGTAAGAPPLKSVSVNHVTGFANNGLMTVGNPVTNPKNPNFSFTNNLVAAGLFPVWSTGGGTTNCAYSNVPVSVIPNCFNPYAYAGNAIFAAPAKYTPTQWPNGNMFPATAATVGFVNFNNGNGGNYALLPTSPYKNKATDGKDIGADMTLVNSTTAGVY